MFQDALFATTFYLAPKKERTQNLSFFTEARRMYVTSIVVIYLAPLSLFLFIYIYIYIYIYIVQLEEKSNLVKLFNQVWVSF